MTKNNSYTANGFLVNSESEPTQRGSISVRKFCVKTKEEYPQLLEFELINKNVALVDGITAGQEVNVSFSLRGREYNGRVFHNLSAFRIEPLKGSVAATPDASPAVKTASKPQATAPAVQQPQAENDEPVF